MTKKTKQLRIRITEAQLKKVSEAILTEKRSKSRLVRKALDLYLKEYNGDNTLKH